MYVCVCARETPTALFRSVLCWAVDAASQRYVKASSCARAMIWKLDREAVWSTETWTKDAKCGIQSAALVLENAKKVDFIIMNFSSI